MTQSKAHKSTLGNRIQRSMPIYLLVLPALLLILIFHYLPIFGISIAFQNFKPFLGISGSKFVGLQHFRRFLGDEHFWRVIRNTVLINLYQLVAGFPVPIIFALMLNELYFRKFKRLVQTVSYLPYFVSWVVVAGMVKAVLSPDSGLVNVLIEKVFGGEPIPFLTKPEYFRTILVISSIWKGFGMSAVYYISALAGIDVQLYEAAAIDGASRWRQIRHITLPGLRNIIIVLFVLNLGSLMSIGFEQIFLLYNPMLYDVGDVISTYTYRLGIQDTQYSLTAAIGLTQSVVNFLLVYSANRISRAVAGWSLW